MTVQILHREIEETDSDCDSRDAKACRSTLVALAAVQSPTAPPVKKATTRTIVNLEHRVVARDRAAVRGGKRVEDSIDQRRLIRVASDRKGPEL